MMEHSRDGDRACSEEEEGRSGTDLHLCRSQRGLIQFPRRIRE